MKIFLQINHQLNRIDDTLVIFNPSIFCDKTLKLKFDFRLKKKWGKWFYLILGIIDPPITVRIARINPAIGKPVCCIGIVVLSQTVCIFY